MLYLKLEAKQEWYANSSSLNVGLANGLNELHGQENITGNGIVQITAT
jgi:hypothetical protein